MSGYTLRLQEVVELRGGATTIVNGVRILDKPELLCMDTYPIATSRDRAGLNGLILDTYWNDEIAHETDDIFVQRFRTVMHTIMPTVNKLYDANAIEFDPLTTMDMRTISSGNSNTLSNRDSQADSTSTNQSASESTNFDLPQMALSGSKDYADAGARGVAESSANTVSSDEATQNDSTTSDGDSRTTGYAGSPAALIQEYRASIVNIDQIVLEEIGELFLQIWGSPHSFIPNRRFF